MVLIQPMSVLSVRLCLSCLVIFLPVFGIVPPHLLSVVFCMLPGLIYFFPNVILTIPVGLDVVGMYTRW